MPQPMNETAALPNHGLLHPPILVVVVHEFSAIRSSAAFCSSVSSMSFGSALGNLPHRSPKQRGNRPRAIRTVSHRTRVVASFDCVRFHHCARFVSSHGDSEWNNNTASKASRSILITTLPRFQRRCRRLARLRSRWRSACRASRCCPSGRPTRRWPARPAGFLGRSGAGSARSS